MSVQTYRRPLTHRALALDQVSGSSRRDGATQTPPNSACRIAISRPATQLHPGQRFAAKTRFFARLRFLMANSICAQRAVSATLLDSGVAPLTSLRVPVLGARGLTASAEPRGPLSALGARLL